MNIYVSNLNHLVTDETLLQTFAAHGQVTSAKVIMDQFTGYSRGFGFVDMPNDAEANLAIEKMNGIEVDGRAVYVKEARPKEERKGSYTTRNPFKNQ
jgi:RNA recognition motif-containing protein